MDARETYRRWLLQLWQGDEAASDVLADDVVAHWPDREVQGREQPQEEAGHVAHEL